MAKQNRVNDLFQSERHILESAQSIIAKADNRSNPLLQEYELLTSSYKRLLRQTNKLLNISDSQQRNLKNVQNDLINLLNNTGQGFLTFASDLLVDKEFSQECVNIFGQKIDNLNILELLHNPADEEQNILLKRIFNLIFSPDSKSRREIYMELLPDNILLNDKHIHLDYKVITQIEGDATQEVLMLILTDISEKIRLENQIERERNQLKTIVNVVVNYNDFIGCWREYRFFVQVKIPQLLQEDNSLRDNIREIYRKVHTFKGSWAMFGMQNTANHLHELENQIASMIEEIDETPIHDATVNLNINHLEEWLQEDISQITNVLGKDFFVQENIVNVDKQKILDIEEKVKMYLPNNDGEVLLKEIRKLRYKNLKALLKIYVDYVAMLSEATEKIVSPLVIEGNDIFIDEDMYAGFIKCLGHVFRNSVDHGIESPNQRLSSGKLEYGTITCLLEIQDDHIVIVVADDGRGVDVNQVREKAIRNGIKDTKTDISDEKLLLLMFEDEFSTRDTVTILSGRGEGLACVKEELDKLAGAIKIRTVVGKGTEFAFILPIITI
ncbi:MAG: ATP-binding protein [Syntrophomonas sp.]|nr:ATP-binding protein [Syntrophomonas sp.]